MLQRIEVGYVPKQNTLAITPEFFVYIRRVANESWGTHIRLRFYPWVYQWIVADAVRSTPDGSRCFDVDRVPILIPMKQAEVFSGKVLGYHSILPGIQLIGFVGAK